MRLEALGRFLPVKRGRARALKSGPRIRRRHKRDRHRRIGELDPPVLVLPICAPRDDNFADPLSWRFPDSDREIKRGGQLIVRESQVAQFVYLGQFGDTFGPGKHELVTDNIPILSTLKGWKYGFESPFKADVYFISTRLFTGNKWGTSNPVMLRDQDFGVIRLRAFGTYDFKVIEPRLFLKEVAGTDQNFRLDEFADTMRSRLVSVFTDSLATAKVPALDVAARYSELGDALLPVINPIVGAKY